MAGIHKARRTLSHGAELFRQVLDPDPADSVEANEDYEVNFSGGDSEFDSDIDIHDEML